ncbi:MAG: hypothetical protein ABJF10_17715 [Chthoniobacter sp.]|uniref:hypothetical protein n=1 Tax=Chthoniobacter sp. TaxID=2510640 RepID=UPI0032A3A086
MKLTWDDLIIQNISPADAQDWIGPWSHLVTGPFAPVFMSKFGDWFLRRPDGSTDELSVIEGTLQRIAATPEEFAAIVNRVEWQEQHLLSAHVAQLHERGLIPGAGECYGFAPHPIFTGRIDIGLARVMSIRVWQSIAAQSFSQAAP